MPRMMSLLVSFPSTIKPAMRTLSPDSTRIRVEMFASCDSIAGVAVGVAGGVAVAVGVANGVAVEVGVGIGVAEGPRVAVGVAVAVAVAVAVGVAVGFGVGVARHGCSHLPAFTINLPQSPV